MIGNMFSMNMTISIQNAVKIVFFFIYLGILKFSIRLRKQTVFNVLFWIYVSSRRNAYKIFMLV